MKAEFNIDTQELVKEIAHDVVKALKPFLDSRGEPDTIFTVEGLAGYLQVSPKWVYERTHLKEIPFYKIGGLCRFRKKDIDRWLDTLKTPAVNPLSRPLKGIK